MGSYDYTCALTDLPIKSGDKVKVIPLIKSSLGLNGEAYSQMGIVYPFVSGYYNEYGFIDDIQKNEWLDVVARHYGYSDVLSILSDLQYGSFSVNNKTVNFSLVLDSAWNSILNSRALILMSCRMFVKALPTCYLMVYQIIL